MKSIKMGNYTCRAMVEYKCKAKINGVYVDYVIPAGEILKVKLYGNNIVPTKMYSKFQHDGNEIVVGGSLISLTNIFSDVIKK